MYSSVKGKFVAVACVMLTAACAQTPDLQSWSDQTARLTGAVAGENQTIRGRYDKVIGLADALNDKQSQSNLEAEKSKFDASARKIESTLEILTVYSGAIVQLAAAGETGADAYKTIKSSIESVSQTLNIGIPAAGVAGDVLNKALESFVDYYTRAEAQESLVAAMEGADGHIAEIATAFEALYDPANGPSYELAVGIGTEEINFTRESAGRSVLKLYRTLAADRAVVFTDELGGHVETTRLDHLADQLSEKIFNLDPDLGICADDPHCPVGETAENTAAVFELADRLEPIYDNYSTSVSDIRVWESKRKTVSAQIVKTIRAWEAEHRRVYEYLDRCGGFRIPWFETECGGLNFSRLLALVEGLKEVGSANN